MMEQFKSVYSSKEFYVIPETIFDLHKESTHTDSADSVIGGISSDTKHSWLALGPYLQVFYTNSAKVRSVWCFGAAAKEPNAKIVCIEELKLPYQDCTLLVVGLQYGSHIGMVCVYNLSCAKVLRAIEIPENVTSIHIVSPGNDSPFPGPLSALDGIIAVGTIGGAVYLIDICRELISESRKLANVLEIRNESRPCQLRILTKIDIHDLEAHKTAAEKEGTHVAILLNESEVSGIHFELKRPEGRNVVMASKQEVDVSALQYAPQLCSIIVGYNFGALQIWNILSISLEYTSSVYEENLPVSFIAIQEPIDDPRAFCYFWAVYSYTDEYQHSFPLAALYALSYESKDYHEGYGYIYRGLVGCAVRFQANLRMVDTVQCNSIIGANCIKLQSYTKVNHTNGNDFVTSNDEYALCMLVWNVRCKEHKFHTYLSIFDLNQWYKEQMPNMAYQQYYMNYMTHLCLTEGNATSNYAILDAQIDPSSIDPYVGVVRLEEHYRPSSLAFNLVTLTEVEVSLQRNLGAQRGLFKELENAGPLALMHPEEFYEAARVLGLAPSFQDMPTDPPSHVQCDILLSVALERKMMKWLCKCATSWGNGSHRSVGLSLELLLNWGWERTRTLKMQADKCCSCLFDYSGVKLDANVRSTITACRVQFGNLKDLFNFIVKHCGTFLVHPEITKQQLSWMQKNYAYFNVIGWMINMKLLPESSATYPVESIFALYEHRRNYLKSIDPKRAINFNEDYLFIDQLTNIETLRNVWRDPDNGNIDGVYPPRSMQSLLRSYFNETLDVKMVHSLIAYAMLDLVMHCQGISENQNISATLIKFPLIFDLGMSTTKMVQAFWQFDHGQLEPAVSQFIGKMIHPQDISLKQHRFIVRILQLQGQYILGLKYLKARNTKGSKEDVKHLIQLYVRNKMMFEALSIERRHNDDELLEAFFFECMQADVLMQLVSFNFTKNEELALIKFMDKLNYSRKEEFKTVYFVRRGRFLDFYIRHDRDSSKRQTIPSLVRNTLDCILPEFTKKLISNCMKLKDASCDNNEGLAAYVSNSNDRAIFNNDLVKAIVSCDGSWKGSDQLTEQDFPLMRPLFSRNQPIAKNIIYTKAVSNIIPCVKTVQEEALNEPPLKRMKLGTPQGDETINITTIDTMFHRSHAQLTPPVVSKYVDTPLSILKNSTHYHRGESTTPEDLNDVRRSMTPKLTGRAAVATTNVRFSGLNSDSNTTSLSLRNSSVLGTNSSNTKESTTTDYFSAEPSPEKPEEPTRKRKLSAEVEITPFTNVDASILRSSIGDSSANRFLESMKKSYVEEALPEVVSTQIHIVEEQPTQPEPLHISSIFIFTGTDDVDTSALTPKARDTYRHDNSRLKEIPLSRQVLECNARAVDREIRREQQLPISKSCSHVDILDNGITRAETRIEVHQENVAGDWKQVIVESEDTVGADGDKNIEDMETADVVTPTPEVKTVLSRTVIDLTNLTPSMNTPLLHRRGVPDYFATPLQSPQTPQQTTPAVGKNKQHWSVNFSTDDTTIGNELLSEMQLSIPKQPKIISKQDIFTGANEFVIDEDKTPLGKSVLGETMIDLTTPPLNASFFNRPGIVDYFASPMAITEIQEGAIKEKQTDLPPASYLKVPLRSTRKSLPRPEVLDFNTTETTQKLSFIQSHNTSAININHFNPQRLSLNITANISQTLEKPEEADNLEITEINVEDSKLIELQTEKCTDKTLPVVELLDTPLIGKCFFEQSATNDFTGSLYGEGNTSQSDGVKIVDVTEEGVDLLESEVTSEDLPELEVNIYEDLSSTMSSTQHHNIDPVMSTYNQPQETDYPSKFTAPEAQHLHEDKSEPLPTDELFESVTPVYGDNRRDDHNMAIDEIISIGSSSEGDKNNTSASNQTSDKISEVNYSDPGELAFIEDSNSRLSSSISHATSTGNLDENVNEVKTSSKSESDVITEASEDVKNEGKETRAEEPQTPKRRTRRSSSSKSDAPAMTIQLRPRRSSVNMESPVPSSVLNEVATSTVTPSKMSRAIMRTRSMSSDAPQIPSPAKTVGRRSMRARSVDVVGLNPLVEEIKPSPRRMSRRLSELRDARSPKPDEENPETPDVNILQARRLTRGQKQILNRTVDRLQLLDKEDFRGSSDPEEVNLLHTSPPSSIASSSAAENAKQAHKLEGKESDLVKKRGRPRKTPTPEPSIESNRSSADYAEPHTPRRSARKTMSAIAEEVDVDSEFTASKKGRRRI